MIMKRTQQLITSLFVMLCCCTGAWATGELNGLFTINASGDKVQFSQGNLQYFCSTSAPEWRFAEHQYDYVSFDISAYAANSEKWIDLFAHGTSGYNNGQANYQPYVVGAASNTYYQGNLTGNADWGYNAISNGGNTENIGWRTLTRDEWLYVFSGRSNAVSKYGHGSINGTNGMILLPDSWTLPDGLSFTSGNSAWTNSYTLEQWSLMENAGAVFLPASGSCNSAGIPSESTQNQNGFYRASTAAYYMYFGQSVLQNCVMSFYEYGDAVRLVKDYTLQQDGEGNYLLGSAYDWKLFATLVQTTPTANAKMTADIDLGDDQTMVGTSSVPYQGSFDGQGHTLKVAYDTSESSIAPFRYVAGSTQTIENLHINGTIYTTGCAAGGVVCSIAGNLTIKKCWVSARIRTQNEGGSYGTTGGICSYCDPTENCTIVIEDCLFSGAILYSSYCGSFMSHVASSKSSVTIRRGLSIGTWSGGDGYQSGTFIRPVLDGIRNIENAFYRYSCGEVQGTHASEAQLADGTTTTALNADRMGDEAVWVQDPITNQPMLKLFATKAYTVPSSGIGTFSAKAKFAVPDGLTAHYCKTYDAGKGTISVVAIEGAVPANTGVLLKGTPGETYTLTGTNDDAGTVEDNALVAVTEATHVDPTSGLYTNFMMKSGKFIRIGESDESVKMSANKAYLQILTSALPSDPTQARDIVLSWDEEDPTGINEVRGKKEDVRGEIYNLSGQRVSKPTKGLYIIGGKKVFIY
jgi:hypothetical protein